MKSKPENLQKIKKIALQSGWNGLKWQFIQISFSELKNFVGPYIPVSMAMAKYIWVLLSCSVKLKQEAFLPGEKACVLCLDK